MFEGKLFIRILFQKNWYKTHEGYAYDMTQDDYIDDEYEEIEIYSNFEDDFDYEGSFNLFEDWLAHGENTLVEWDNNTAFEIILNDYDDNLNDFCDIVYEYLEDNEIKDKDLWDKAENLHEVATNLFYYHHEDFDRNIYALKEAYYDFVKVAKEKNII